MIITSSVKLKINSKTISHYIKLGYDAEINKECEIKVKDLTHGCKVNIIAKCDICGLEKLVSYKEYNRNISKYNIFTCSNGCASIKNKMTSIEKYGTDHFSKTHDYKNKVKKTNKNKYGSEYYTQTDDYKLLMKNKNIDYSKRVQKQKKTILDKYGNENYHKTEHYDNQRNNIIKNYQNTITKKLLTKYDNLISTNNNDFIFLCKKGHDFTISRDLLKNRSKSNTELCTVCNPIGSSKSGYELQLIDFISKNYDNDILRNKRIILGDVELDIYLPDLRLAFEFNGLWWHNEINKPNNYHLNKTEKCEKNGIQLIHIYEDDWLFKREIVKSRILNLLGKNEKIYARKCEIKEVGDNKIIRDFLCDNHIQGFIGSKIKIGLFYNGELISLMTFGNLRKSMGQKKLEGSYEMLRFCNKLNVNIIGGASKLFKYFIRNYNPIEVISYADRSWSKGNLYEKLGFQFLHKTDPNYYYVIEGKRRHRFGFRKDKLIKDGADENKTEHEIMLEKKIFRIYDSGSLKYTYEKNQSK